MINRNNILPVFPQRFAQLAVATYVLALIAVSVRFMSYAMNWYWWLFGLVGVMGFFFGASSLTRKWGNLKEKRFEKHVFWTAFSIRAIMVFVLYWFFKEMTGKPFMFWAADSVEYHFEAVWMIDCLREGNFEAFWSYLMDKGGISDAGYSLWLGVLYFLTDKSIIAARLMKSALNAYMCVLIYRLTRRNFNEQAGRIAAIFCMLEPHFIIYCGMHLKETEMIFLLVFFLERADNLLRSNNFRFWAIAPILLLMLGLFTFRTVLGVATCMSFALALMLSNQKVASVGRRWFVLIVFVAGASMFVGGRVAHEIQEYWNARGTNQEKRMSVIRKKQGLAQYATKAVFAPMIFTIPFPTMVETKGQENSRMLHSGLVVKNVLSYFCILSIFLLIFNTDPKTNWRNNVLIGSYLILYLLIIIQSAFVHVDRFHLPAYIIEIVFAAYGVTLCNNPKYKRWFRIWMVFMFVAWVAWNWFKLAGRGLAD